VSGSEPTALFDGLPAGTLFKEMCMRFFAFGLLLFPEMVQVDSFVPVT
jgi:hypothetical protein